MKTSRMKKLTPAIIARMTGMLLLAIALLALAETDATLYPLGQVAWWLIFAAYCFLLACELRRQFKKFQAVPTRRLAAYFLLAGIAIVFAALLVSFLIP